MRLNYNSANQHQIFFGCPCARPQLKRVLRVLPSLPSSTTHSFLLLHKSVLIPTPPSALLNSRRHVTQPKENNNHLHHNYCPHNCHERWTLLVPRFLLGAPDRIHVRTTIPSLLLGGVSQGHLNVIAILLLWICGMLTWGLAAVIQQLGQRQ